jgi:hypothetical protein
MCKLLRWRLAVFAYLAESAVLLPLYCPWQRFFSRVNRG